MSDRWRNPWIRTVPLLVSLLLAPACDDDGGDDDDTVPGEPGPMDLDADSDRDGVLDADQEEDAVEEDAPGALVRVNVDDDNGDAVPDDEAQATVDEENDLALALLSADSLATLPEGATVELALEGDADLFRVFVDGHPALGPISLETVTAYVLEDAEGSEPLVEVEGLEFRAQATLAARLVDADGVVLDEDRVLLTTPPLMLYNNTDPAEELWVCQDSWNATMRSQIEEAIGAENLRTYPSGTYGWDVWVQDEMEFAYQQTAEGPMQMVMDLIRNGPLDALPEAEFLGPDFGWLVRGDNAMGNSLDSGGNLDCTPPLTAHGVEYPFGRIYYGGGDSGNPWTGGAYHLDAAMREFLDDQEIQAPVEFDTTWLAVGHVDEISAFVPDPSSDRGFRLLFTDVMLGISIVESLDPAMSISRYPVHGFSTVGDILDDAIIQYNEDLDALYLQPVLAAMMDAFDLSEDDVIFVPGLFEQVHGTALAMIPGMVNMAVYDDHLLIADPFFREYAAGIDEEDADGDFVLDEGEDLNGDGLLNTYNDPFVQYMEDNMPPDLELHWIDDWQSYHLYWGEVHCGTNIVRTPRTDVVWWEVE